MGDWVYLKLQPYKQTSVALRKSLKLAAKYHEPVFIEEKIGKVAYQLQLPPSTAIHSVFYVSLLKKNWGIMLCPQLQFPTIVEEEAVVAPKDIL